MTNRVRVHGPTPTEHRDQLKSDLTMFWDFLNEPSSLVGATFAQIRVRKSNVQELWHDFQEVQSRLEAEDAENIEEHFRVRVDFEELYFKCLAEAERRSEGGGGGTTAGQPSVVEPRGVAAGASSDEDDAAAGDDGNRRPANW